MKAILAVALLLAIGPMTRGQVLPAASRGTAKLRYSLNYSETVGFGGPRGSWHTISPSAALTYFNGRKRFPLSLEYAGGYMSTLSGLSYMSGAFQHLLISQEFNYRKWNLGITDDVAYRPQSPTTGFSGIPGTGEPIGPGSTPLPSQLILTLNTHALENVASGDVHHTFNRLMRLDVEASHDLLHYPDGNGLDTNSVAAHAGLSVRANSRNWLTTQYARSRFTYPAYNFQITTSELRFGLNRIVTRSFHVNAAAGPEWVSISNAILPASTQVSVQAGLDYQYRRMSAALSYVRETSGGSGYMIGSESDTLSASLSRVLGRTFTFQTNGGYSHNSPLTRHWDVSSIYGGVQTSRRLARNMDAFLNYTVTAQASSLRVPSNVQDDVIHSISCGIGFARQTRSSR